MIEFLLNRDTFPADIAGHIRTLKDVKELNVTEKRDFDDKCGANNDHVDNQDSRFICPVVGLEMSGKYKFFYSRKCGCVLSERALKEVKTDDCHKCGQPFDESDLVVINGSEEEVSKLRQLMEERREKAKAEKRGKKRKAADSEATSSKVTSEATSSKVTSEATSSKVTSEATSTRSSDSVPSTSNGNQAIPSAPSTSSNVKSWTPGRSSTTKVSTTKVSTKVSTEALLTDKAKRDYSVAKDPNASETYKSLFTSHETAKKKPTGNWVTYNPLYF